MRSTTAGGAAEKRPDIRSVWQVCREYAGIAEAGGVKNVVCSLAEGFARLGMKAAVFVPLYGFIRGGNIESISFPGFAETAVRVGRDVLPVRFFELLRNNVRIVLVDCSVYLDKTAVYTYTAEDEKNIPGAVRGKGHCDSDIMNIVLQKAVVSYAQATETAPDVLLCQDAHTALLPAFIACDRNAAALFSETEKIVTIHNAGAGYHQQIADIGRAEFLSGLPRGVLERGSLNGAVEPFLVAAEYARLTTVSPWYAEELTDPSDIHSGGLSAEFCRRGIGITGITNGIDYEKYNPENTEKSLLPAPFTPAQGDFEGKKRCLDMLLSDVQSGRLPAGMEQFGTVDGDGAVYISYHGRIAMQKGLDVLAAAAEKLLQRMPECRFIVMGQGDDALEQLHIRLADQFSGRYVFLRGYERSVARLTVAASDFLALPSRFEPCGLEDFIGQIYGTVPVAHAVGGLKKILDGKTGFLYACGSGNCDNREDSPEMLEQLLFSLCMKKLEDPAFFDGIRRFASSFVRSEYSWDTVIGKQYMPLFAGECKVFAAKTENMLT